MYSEVQLIERIRAEIPSISGPLLAASAPGNVALGIGDDGAVLSPQGDTDWVLSCDAFLEGVHFLSGSYPPDSVGYKSLVRATSDLAAMGATPTLFLLTLALPANRTGAWLGSFLQGMGRAARRLGLRLAGGDTTKFPLVSISLTVLGEVEKGAAITRSGARPGDHIYVSGRLGRALLGFELLRRGLGGGAKYRRLLKPHLYPEARLELGAWLARKRLASAMMDLSDGLSTDLHRLCGSSAVGARLIAERIPAVQIPAIPRLARGNLDPLSMALHGGEDYELLFTVPANKNSALRRAPGSAELTEIGEITRGREVVLVSSDGRGRRLKPQGWDPFKKS
jgi:thiamine-monophosphate kinase